MGDPFTKCPSGNSESEAWEEYLDYRVGLCDGSEATKEVAQHLSTCHKCCEIFELHFRYFEVIRSHGEVCAPKSLRARIVAMTIGWPS